MTNQNTPQNDPLDAELDGKLDGALRKMARETHPRRAFVAQLRGELETQAAHPRRDFWSLLRSARPWLAQTVLIAALVGLVLIGGTLTSRLFSPDGGEPREVGSSLPTSAAGDSSDALPVGALARLGRGKIQSIDAAPDGRIAVGSTAGLCLYNTGLTPDWCRWTDAPVHAALFDPTGTRLAVRYGTDLIEIWDAAQGQVIASREFSIPTSYTSPNLPNPNFFIIKVIAWEPESSRLAVIENGQGVSAWDWQNDTIAWGPVAVGGESIGVDWLTGPEGESIVAALTPESLTLVDGSTGQAMSTLSDLAGAAPGSFLTLAHASQGSRIAVGLDDKISVFDLAAWNANLYQSIPHPAGRFQSIALSADGTQIATQSDQTFSQIITFDLRTGQETARIPSMASSPMVWSAADGRLYYASPDGSLAYFDGSRENLIASGHTLTPQVIAWRDDGTVITASDNFIYAWDASTQALASFSEMTLTDQVLEEGLSKDGTRALFFDPSASDVVNAARIIVWDVVNNQPLQDIEVGGFVHAVTLSPDGTRLAAVHGSGQIFTWKLLDNGSEERDVSGIRDFTSVDALAFDPGGDNIAVAYRHSDQTSSLELWNIASQTMVIRLAPAGGEQFDTPITSLAWSEDATFLGATQGQQVWVWDATTMQPVVIASQPDGNSVYALGALQFHPTINDRYAAAHNRVFSLAPGELVEFNGHALRVNDLAYRPDGKALASASNDGTVILWDLGAGNLPPVEVRPTETPLPGDIPTPTATPTAGYMEYTVLEGDTCGGIAFNFGISVDSLIALNNLSPKCDNVYVGQVLRVPYPTPTPPGNYTDPTAPLQEYTVVEGDTCGGIAYTFNISVESLITFNDLAPDCSNVFVGQKLLIPYPTPTPFPTNTRDPNPIPPNPTWTPGGTTPLPNATQRPIPDTTGYDVSQTSGISPSGKWTWLAIRGEWTENAPREEDLNFILVDSVDGPENWVLEEYTPHGLGEGKPTGFTFSADDRYLFFYDEGTPDGCGLPFQGNVMRMDLQTGIVAPVIPLLQKGVDHLFSGNFSFSPDASLMAVVSKRHVDIYNTSRTDSPVQKIPLPFEPPSEWFVSFIGWEDTGTLLALEIVSPPEGLCGTPVAEYQRWTVVTNIESGTAWSFPNTPGNRLRLWSDDREGSAPGSLIYHAIDGSEIIVDPLMGKVVPAE